MLDMLSEAMLKIELDEESQLLLTKRVRVELKFGAWKIRWLMWVVLGFKH